MELAGRGLACRHEPETIESLSSKGLLWDSDAGLKEALYLLAELGSGEPLAQLVDNLGRCGRNPLAALAGSHDKTTPQFFVRSRQRDAGRSGSKSGALRNREALDIEVPDVQHRRDSVDAGQTANALRERTAAAIGDGSRLVAKSVNKCVVARSILRHHDWPAAACVGPGNGWRGPEAVERLESEAARVEQAAASETVDPLLVVEQLHRSLAVWDGGTSRVAIAQVRLDRYEDLMLGRREAELVGPLELWPPWRMEAGRRSAAFLSSLGEGDERRQLGANAAVARCRPGERSCVAELRQEVTESPTSIWVIPHLRSDFEEGIITLRSEQTLASASHRMQLVEKANMQRFQLRLVLLVSGEGGEVHSEQRLLPAYEAGPGDDGVVAIGRG